MPPNGNKIEYPALRSYTANQVVHVGPALVHVLAISGDGANADADVYDGLSDKGEKRAHLETLSGTSFALPLPNPVYFEHGIYIAVNADTTTLIISYEPLPPTP